MVAFCDIIEEKAIKAAKEYGVEGAKVYTDYRELLKDESIEVVHVLTPNRSHADITIDALHAGKHVMCEKPMAKTAVDAKRMVEAAKETGKKLTIGYQHRHKSASQYAKQYIDRPFEVSDGQPVVLNETLPGRHGTMCMVFNNRGVAVFVWMGFDKTEDMPQSSRMSGLMKRAAYCLARELHTEARARLRARNAEEKKS